MSVSTAAHTDTAQADRIPLNTRRIPNVYSALVRTRENRRGQISETAIVWEFKLACFGPHPQGGMGYKLETQKRFLLDSRNRPLKKLTAAQQVALMTAKINDKLVLRTNRHYGLLEVVNIPRIYKRWKTVKSWLLQKHPDMKDHATDFDWQFENEQIQKRYLTDPFFSFFLGDFFNRALPYSDQRILTNGMGTIDLPVAQNISIQGQKPEAVQLTGNLDTGACNFQQNKMNAFLGQLVKKSGIQHPVIFDYTGNYRIGPESGLITGGYFKAETEIDELYCKTIIIDLNLEENG